MDDVGDPIEVLPNSQFTAESYLLSLPFFRPLFNSFVVKFLRFPSLNILLTPPFAGPLC